MQSKLRKANRGGSLRNKATRRGRRVAAEVNTLPLSKKARGHPAWVPDQKDRDFVQVMSGYGATHDEIAAVLKISDVTLRKHCAVELERGSSLMDADLRWTLHMRAVGGPKREWQKASDTALIFVCKTRLRMVEPAKEQDIGDLRIESLTDRQLDILIERVLARRNREYGPSGEEQAKH